jgi:hypothetical protein
MLNFILSLIGNNAQETVFLPEIFQVWKKNMHLFFINMTNVSKVWKWSHYNYVHVDLHITGVISVVYPLELIPVTKRWSQ